jgi:hypothetical protein
MAYTKPLGGIVSTVEAAAAVARDPYLPEVVNLVLQLKEQEKESASSGGGSTGTGVGLRNVVGPLRTFVAIQERPWILPLAVAGGFGLIFAAGYFTRKAVAK